VNSFEDYNPAMLKSLTRLVVLLPFVVAPVLAQGAPATPQGAQNPLGLKPHHITASVTDIERAVKWYQDMLGFKLDQQTGRGADLSISGFGIGLVQTGGRGAAPTAAGAPVAPPIPAPAPPAAAPPGARWIHIVFAVADPDATFKILKDRGANPRSRGAAGQPIASFTVLDSEGNEIEFVKN
jgi:catechol 2,3-dioxygenase-like lactoylglutathione lyase family enzyme